MIAAMDIGTTKICALAVDADGRVIDELNADTPYLPPEGPHAYIQDAGKIADIAGEMLAALKNKHGRIDCVGVSGQMHGILYLNENGRAVSPLYTWQDGAGNLIYKDELTYAEYLNANGARGMASGYGLATHFYKLANGAAPAGAAKLCTIGDYIAMRLTGRKQPLIHATNAAGLGFFDGNGFMGGMLEKNGINPSMLPDCTDKTDVAGVADGAAVAVAIGDNQAGFLGSVGDWEDSALANIGTGSQISFAGGNETYELLERRPFFEGKALHVGACLCGGKAYALLESFFRGVVKMAGHETDGPLYAAMQKCLDAYGDVNPLPVDTRFDGTRKDPGVRGRITNISLTNFNPGAMIAGFLNGIAAEMKHLLPVDVRKFSSLVASGNGARKNPGLVQALSELFGIPVKIPLYPEEAAYGAALFAMAASGLTGGLEDARRFVRYRGE